MLTDLTTSERSPFFQHFALMELGHLPVAKAISLLTDLGPKDRPISRTIAEQAVRVLGGHPFYLQLFGETLTSTSPPYDEDALKWALQQVLFSRTGRLALYFEREYQQLVGRSTSLAATLQQLSGGPVRLTDLASSIRSPSGATVRFIERLGDAVLRNEDGLYQLSDTTFGLWLSWRKPGGTVVPMNLVGDEAERAVAEHLATMGFDLIYQSKASRGAFDLLATRDSRQLGVQVKRSGIPLSLPVKVWTRMEAEAERFHWHWVVAVMTPEGEVVFLDPSKARRRRGVRLDERAAIDNLLRWLDRQRGY
jgi:hypothetical protein